MADSSWLGAGGTRKVAVAVKDCSECPDGVHDHPSNPDPSASLGQELPSFAKLIKTCSNSLLVMLLEIFEILKVMGFIRSFFGADGRAAPRTLPTLPQYATANANTSDQMTVTNPSIVASMSISGILGGPSVGRW
jgi:hypothetical protein